MACAIRTDRFRYVEWIRPDRELAARELYDHDSDPVETGNLAVRPDHSNDLKRLHAQLHAGWKAALPPESDY
jgi:arylsulfatase A-like enzyme